jgi:hypothetical protein
MLEVYAEARDIVENWMYLLEIGDTGGAAEGAYSLLSALKVLGFKAWEPIER